MANPVEAISGKGAFAITPSDTTVFVARALYVGTSGNVVAVMESGQTATFYSVPGGTILPISCTQVKAATTASNITGITY